MYGAGLAVFAVWGYVIAKVRESTIELNPKKLADTLGGTTEEVERAIEYLTKPDPESRHKEDEGKRLVREGQFQYRVPSWKHYQEMRNEADRREYNRIKQAEHRAKKRLLKGKPGVGEIAHLRAMENGDERALEIQEKAEELRLRELEQRRQEAELEEED